MTQDWGMSLIEGDEEGGPPKLLFFHGGHKGKIYQIFHGGHPVDFFLFEISA